jgi:hydroxymethylbilane synthase
MASAPLRIGTRGSQLAVTQTGQVVDQLRSFGAKAELVRITTRGDLRHDEPVHGLGGDGVFVRELEQALLDGQIDVAVHSLKDLPTATTPGLVVAAVPARALPFDVLVAIAPGTALRGLRPGAVVGTSSVRRVAQVRALRPDLVVRPLRGNVDTRLRRLDAGDYDALILAGAGLERLALAARITEVLAPPDVWPAVGQGALAVQIRSGDDRAAAAVAPLDHPPTHAAVRAERACLHALASGCLAPVGGWARPEGHGRLAFGACVLEMVDEGVTRLTIDSGTPGQGHVALPPGPVDESPEALGARAAALLVAHGADAMLARMRRHASVVPGGESAAGAAE